MDRFVERGGGQRDRTEQDRQTAHRGSLPQPVDERAQPVQAIHALRAVPGKVPPAAKGDLRRREARAKYLRVGLLDADTVDAVAPHAVALAQALLDRKLSAEQPLAILSDNDIEHFPLALGAMLAGVPFSPISAAYSLLSQDFAPIEERLPSIRARLEGIPAVFAAAQANLVRSPAIWNEIAMEALRA